MMQTLAENGNGTAAYIDTLDEAREGAGRGGQLDAGHDRQGREDPGRVQPGQVAEYRLIGYENRALNREDFNNDKVDAGEIGAGHTVTALYEITPKGSAGDVIDDLRYGAGHDRQAASPNATSTPS